MKCNVMFCLKNLALSWMKLNCERAPFTNGRMNAFTITFFRQNTAPSVHVRPKYERVHERSFTERVQAQCCSWKCCQRSTETIWTWRKEGCVARNLLCILKWEKKWLWNPNAPKLLTVLLLSISACLAGGALWFSIDSTGRQQYFASQTWCI